MPSVFWVSLPSEWTITEVQAGLQVFIALLCTWGIFAFSRFCWQLSSNLVKKNRAVALASLMSITTIGEAYDVIILLKRRIFLTRYWKLLAQSIVVISLTVATIVSGPIAKASTRLGTVQRIVTIPGLLAKADYNSRTYANVAWNETSASLDRAGFPLDQLLDFQPSPNSTWLYRANEWNNTWSMQCNKTEDTPLVAVDVGVCGNMSVEIPVINDIFDYNTPGLFQSEENWSAHLTNSSWVQDAIIIITGWNYNGGFDRADNTTYNMTVTLVTVHVHGLPNTPENSNSSCAFGPGRAQSASYTKASCFLSRKYTIPDENIRAFPDCSNWWALPQGYLANFWDRFAAESNENKPITMVSPDELIRFYQTYILTKDVQYPSPVSRQLTADVELVQLSSTFIALGGLYALMVILGLINYGIFAYTQGDVMRDTPESKLDWIVQSIMDESELRNRSMARRSVVAPSLRPELSVRGAEKVRAVFENAKYGGTIVEEIPLTDSPSAYNGNPFSGTPNSGSYPFPNQSPYPGTIFDVSPPNLGHGFPSMTNTAYNGYAGDQMGYYNMNPYEASFAAEQAEQGRIHEIQNPDTIFSSDRRRGYSRLG